MAFQITRRRRRRHSAAEPGSKDFFHYRRFFEALSTTFQPFEHTSAYPSYIAARSRAKDAEVERREIKESETRSEKPAEAEERRASERVLQPGRIEGKPPREGEEKRRRKDRKVGWLVYLSAQCSAARRRVQHRRKREDTRALVKTAGEEAQSPKKIRIKAAARTERESGRERASVYNRTSAGRERSGGGYI